MDAHGGLLYMVAYNLRKVENRDRYPDPPSFVFCDQQAANHAFGVFLLCGGISELAQRKRVGLITQRSEDRNLPSLLFGCVSRGATLWPSG